MKVVSMNIGKLIPYENNPRNNDTAVQSLVNSIKEFGFLQPIVVDKDHVIIVGHTRFEAAKLLDIVSLPVLVAEDLTQKQVNAYRIADNKIAQLATWDQDLERQELQKVAEEIDMSLFGFITQDSGIQGFAGGSIEMSLDDFGDDEFKYECPGCGFRFNG